MINEILKLRLEKLANDEITLSAISALINERIEKERPIVTNNDDDKKLGEKFRAYETAKDMLNGFFVDIESYKNKSETNQGFQKEQ